ncbi:DinB family protein [Gracilimonas mengyeensis]|uniref:DinB superfamily protein n=1 Tax=Gracilimonas mengyeensis TaxID=1302730 RepID=A0A521E1M3_9BACT|nr:DinB family protein [Gracilimonas mengyeensis]SMO77869.1 DinB superfamily protein [Gracilimonas mengyeensis]
MQYTYQYFSDALEDAKKQAQTLVSDLDKETFLRRPAEDKWCIGEILSHLVQAGNQYYGQINARLSEPDASLIKGKPPFEPGFVFRWFIRQVSPQNKRPLPTVPSFEPVDQPDLDKEVVLQDFLELQDKLLASLKSAELQALDLDRIKTKNPVVKFVPMSLTSCFGITEAHQRRHFEQIRNLREAYEG